MKQVPEALVSTDSLTAQGPNSLVICWWSSVASEELSSPPRRRVPNAKLQNQKVVGGKQLGKASDWGQTAWKQFGPIKLLLFAESACL